MAFADLHLHTHFSDGTFSPCELAERAQTAGLSAIALTDHDTLEGCSAVATECKARGLEFIVGTELTAEHLDHEVHILGYDLDASSVRLQNVMRACQAVRETRIHTMVERLNEKGIPLQLDHVLSIANCKSPGRPHVARALVEKGFCKDFDDAFDRFLKKGKPAWIPKARMSALDAIQLIHEAHGTAILAHPGLYNADFLIPDLAKLGLDGLECWHSKHTANTSARYCHLAHEFDLVTTGGSDCHGMSKGKPLIGTVRLPYHHVETLRTRLNTRRRRSIAIEKLSSP